MKFLTKKKLNNSTYLLLAIAACSVFTVKEKAEAVIRRSASLGSLGSGGASGVTNSGIRRAHSSPSVFPVTTSMPNNNNSRRNLGNRNETIPGRPAPLTRGNYKFGFDANGIEPFEGLNPGKKYVQFVNKNNELKIYEKTFGNRFKLFLKSEIGTDVVFDSNGRSQKVLYRTSPNWVSGKDIMESVEEKTKAVLSAVNSQQTGMGTQQTTGGATGGRPGSAGTQNIGGATGGRPGSAGTQNIGGATGGRPGSASRQNTGGATGGRPGSAGTQNTGSTGEGSGSTGVEFQSHINIFLKDGRVKMIPINDDGTPIKQNNQQQTGGAIGGTSTGTGGGSGSTGTQNIGGTTGGRPGSAGSQNTGSTAGTGSSQQTGGAIGGTSTGTGGGSDSTGTQNIGGTTGGTSDGATGNGQIDYSALGAKPKIRHTSGSQQTGGATGETSTGTGGGSILPKYSGLGYKKFAAVPGRNGDDVQGTGGTPGGNVTQAKLRVTELKEKVKIGQQGQGGSVTATLDYEIVEQGTKVFAQRVIVDETGIRGVPMYSTGKDFDGTVSNKTQIKRDDSSNSGVSGSYDLRSRLAARRAAINPDSDYDSDDGGNVGTTPVLTGYRRLSDTNSGGQTESMETKLRKWAEERGATLIGVGNNSDDEINTDSIKTWV